MIMNQFALVQMKVTAGAIERPKQDNPQKGNGLACGDIKQLLSPYPSWLIFFLYFCVLLVFLALLVA